LGNRRPHSTTTGGITMTARRHHRPDTMKSALTIGRGRRLYIARDLRERSVEASYARVRAAIAASKALPLPATAQAAGL